MTTPVSRPCAPTVAEVASVTSREEALSIQAKIEPLVAIPVRPSKQGRAADGRIDPLRPKTILALDIAYSTYSTLTVASGVLYRWGNNKMTGTNDDQLVILAERVTSGRATFGYHPGLLAFREIPLLAEVLEALLPLVPGPSDMVLLCDGAGIAHPRFCGLACHLGVLYQCMSIGVAKNHLIGDYDTTLLGPERGSHSMLRINGREVGSVLRSQDGIRPIFVSPGHQVSIQDAMHVVLQLCTSYRHPEPLRRADHIGRMELKRLEQAS